MGLEQHLFTLLELPILVGWQNSNQYGPPPRCLDDENDDADDEKDIGDDDYEEVDDDGGNDLQMF